MKRSTKSHEWMEWNCNINTIFLLHEQMKCERNEKWSMKWIWVMYVLACVACSCCDNDKDSPHITLKFHDDRVNVWWIEDSCCYSIVSVCQKFIHWLYFALTKGILCCFRAFFTAIINLDFQTSTKFALAFLTFTILKLSFMWASKALDLFTSFRPRLQTRWMLK